MALPERVSIETDNTIPIEEVENALRIVNDPELMLDIVTLELIKRIVIKDHTIHVWMTLTTPFCPYGPSLVEQAKIALESIPSVREAHVELDLSEPWEPSEHVKSLLGLP